MKFTFEDGKIQISLYQLMQDLSDEQMRELAAAVQWEPPILNDFVEALMGDTGYRTFLPDLTKARLKFIELMPIAAAEVIRSLQNRLDSAEAEQKRWAEYVWVLKRAWPDSCNPEDHERGTETGVLMYRQFRLPKEPDWVSAAWKTREEVLATLPPEAQPVVRDAMAEEIEI